MAGRRAEWSCRACGVVRCLVVAAAILAGAPAARAQDAPPGALEGSVTAGGAGRPSQSVTVSVTRLEPEPVLARSARTDSLGRYRIDSLPAGRWLLEISSALLDSLQLALGAREVRIDAGATARVDLSVPSEGMVRAAIESAERSAAQAAIDSVTGELQLTGTASLAGVVRGVTGEPLAGVQLHVRDALGSVASDSAGRYLLAALPAGTHVLVARRLGYALLEQVVELRDGARTTADLRMERSVSLDSMRVTAMGGRFREFEFNRGANIFGRYLTRDQILRRRPEDVAALLRRLGGFTVVGQGGSARVFTKRELTARQPCETNVVIDRVQRRRINDVPPLRIVGLEAYTGPGSFSSDFDFDAKCGLVVIWTSAWRAPRGG
jgi:hypothetical protein